MRDISEVKQRLRWAYDALEGYNAELVIASSDDRVEVQQDVDRATFEVNLLRWVLGEGQDEEYEYETLVFPV